MSKNKKQSVLVIIKPEIIHKNILGNVLTKISETNLEIIAIKLMTVSRALAEEHYRHIKGKPFFENTVRYMMGEYHQKKVVVIVYNGDNAIEKIREIAGATNPEDAKPSSLRGAYGRITKDDVYENVIHASSDKKEAEREIKLWFKPNEVSKKIYPTKSQSTTSKEDTWA